MMIYAPFDFRSKTKVNNIDIGGLNLRGGKTY